MVQAVCPRPLWVAQGRMFCWFDGIDMGFDKPCRTFDRPSKIEEGDSEGTRGCVAPEDVVLRKMHRLHHLVVP